MEREHIYFRGQADALAYLNKVGAFKMEQWLKTLRSDMHRLKEYLHIKQSKICRKAAHGVDYLHIKWQYYMQIKMEDVE